MLIDNGDFQGSQSIRDQGPIFLMCVCEPSRFLFMSLFHFNDRSYHIFYFNFKQMLWFQILWHAKLNKHP